MTGAALVAILAFGAGVIEGVLRGAGIGSVAAAALAGLVWGTIAAGVLALAAGLRWLLPAELRTGAWALALALTLVVFVAAECAVARGLALRFRDPALVALVAAVAGVVLVWVCVALVVPLAVRVVGMGERRGAVPRMVRGVGLAVMLGGAAALVGWIGQTRIERPRSDLVGWTIALAEQITDIDGDGDGLMLPPRDCAPLSPKIDGRVCAGR